VSAEIQQLLFDPQTSGGLLIAIAPQFAGEARSLLADANCPAMQVGEVTERTSPAIKVF
jgi:selenide,water dikinase